MFDLHPSEEQVLTQKSANSYSQESQQESSGSQRSVKKSPIPVKARATTPPTEIRTQDLPGSDFMSLPKKYDTDSEVESKSDDNTVELVADEDDDATQLHDEEGNEKEVEDDEQTTW
jgi:hypothetical protein